MKAVTLYSKGTYLVNGVPAETAAIPAEEAAAAPSLTPSWRPITYRAIWISFRSNSTLL